MKRKIYDYISNTTPYTIKNELGVASFLAWKNLTFHKKTLLLVSLIIGLGFLSATFSASVITGLRVMIEDKAINTMTGNILLVPKDNHDYITNVKEVEKKLLAIPGVVAVSPHYVSQVMLIDKDGNKVGAQLRIVDPKKEAEVTWVDDSLIAGRYLSRGSRDSIYIGGSLTKKYTIAHALPTIDADAGDTVTLIAGGGTTKKVKIGGIYAMKFIASEMYVYITKNEAKRFFNLSDDELNNYATEILVKTSTKGEEKKVVEQINKMNIDAKAYTWQERLGTIAQFTDSLMIITKITMIIGIIISFGTIYIMIVINVLQKRSQIGILKAIGISEFSILLSYIFQSILYAILGSLVGLFITFILLRYFSYHPIPMPMGNVVPLPNVTLYHHISVLFVVASIIAGYVASRGTIKDKILDLIFKG